MDIPELLGMDDWLVEKQGLDYQSGYEKVFAQYPKLKEELEKQYKQYEEEVEATRVALVEHWISTEGEKLYITSYSDYAEAGYDLGGKKGILVGDWNDVRKDIVSLIEEYYQIEWSDEWISCSDCGKLIRTQPDSYSWTPDYNVGDGEVYCGDCIRKDESSQEAYVQSLINDPTKIDTLGVSLEKLGFTLITGHCDYGLRESNSNYHPGKMLKKLQEAIPGVEVVFGDLSSEQFENNFRMYARMPDGVDEDKFIEKLVSLGLIDKDTGEPVGDRNLYRSLTFFDSCTDPGGTAERMKEGLKNAAIQQAELDGSGIKYSWI